MPLTSADILQIPAIPPGKSATPWVIINANAEVASNTPTNPNDTDNVHSRALPIVHPDVGYIEVRCTGNGTSIGTGCVAVLWGFTRTPTINPHTTSTSTWVGDGQWTRLGTCDTLTANSSLSFGTTTLGTDGTYIYTVTHPVDAKGYDYVTATVTTAAVSASGGVWLEARQVLRDFPMPFAIN